VWPGHIGGDCWLAVVGARLEGMGGERGNRMGDCERKFEPQGFPTCGKNVVIERFKTSVCQQDIRRVL